MARLSEWGLELPDRPQKQPIERSSETEAAVRAARNLSWVQRAAVLASPDGDFPRPDVIKSRAKTLSWLIARGIYQRLGTHSGGRWLYRLTPLGIGVRAILQSGELEPPRPRYGWAPGEPREYVKWGASDSDGSPEGEDALAASSETTARADEGGIAHPTPTESPSP